MAPELDLPRALLRGRYMAAVARMEWTGVPIDTAVYDRLEAAGTLKGRLIAEVDRDYGVYDGLSFKADRFAAYLTQSRYPLAAASERRPGPRGRHLQQQARAPSAAGALAPAPGDLGKLRLNELAVGSDGRNRCLLSRFRPRRAAISPPTPASFRARRSGCVA